MCIQVNLAAICSEGGDAVAEKEKVELKKRKLVQEITEKIYILEKGSNFTTSITKVIYVYYYYTSTEPLQVRRIWWELHYQFYHLPSQQYIYRWIFYSISMVKHNNRLSNRIAIFDHLEHFQVSQSKWVEIEILKYDK